MAIADVRLGGSLAREHHEQYRRDGFVTLRGVFPREEMDGLQREADRLFQRTDLIDSDNIRCRWQNQLETGSAASIR